MTDNFLQFLQSFWSGAQSRLCDTSCGPSLLHQLGMVFLVVAAAFPLSRLAGRGLLLLVRDLEPAGQQRLEAAKKKILDLIVPLLAALLLWVVSLIGFNRHWDIHLVNVALDLMVAWVIIRLAAGFFVSAAWSRLFAAFIWLVAAMDIMGVLSPTAAYLDQLGVNLDNGRLSLLMVIKAAIMLAILLPLASWVCRLLQGKLEEINTLTPRVYVLLVKLLKSSLYTMAILVALDSVGFDFHLLMVAIGAVGLGVGFGFQKVVSNLVSGVIILADNSIRPGDVIEVGGTYGKIESLHSRFVSVTTLDGTSFLIPNDDLVTRQVVNWSFNGPGVRLKIPVGVAYGSDVRQAMDLMVAAALEFPRVLRNPKPSPRLIKFADSSIQLELRLWIRDPDQGITNIKSDIQLRIWESYKEHGIEFPFPQQDLHLKSPAEFTVRIKGSGEMPDA
jgi:small-conductance mechanosensitive channel